MKLTITFKNTAALLGSQIYAKFTGAVFFFVAARTLSKENFGAYTLVITFISFFYIFSDWGLSTLTIRDVAKSTESAKDYLSNSLPVRLVIAFITYTILVIVSIALSYPKYITALLIVGGLSIFANTILAAFNAILSAHEKMYIPAALGIFFSTLYVASGGFCLFYKTGLMSLMFVLIILNITNVFVTGILVKQFLLPIKFTMDFSKYKNLFKNATPYALLSVLGVIHFRVDIVILSKLRTMEEVGLYNAVYKIVDFLMFLPVCYMGACFPKTARQIHSDRTEMWKDYGRHTKYLLLFILPIVIIFTIFSRQIVILLFGRSFIASVGTLRILLWSVVIMYINAPMGNILYNSEKIYKFIPYAIFNTTLNILLNVILIPTMGIAGAGITTLATEATGLLLIIYLLKKFNL